MKDYLFYIHKFNLHLEYARFNRSVFLEDLGKDFLETLRINPIGLDPETGETSYLRFKEIVKDYQALFDKILEYTQGNKFSRRLWNAFYAIYVVPYRIKHFPEEAKIVSRFNNTRNRQKPIRPRNTEPRDNSEKLPELLAALKAKYPDKYPDKSR